MKRAAQEPKRLVREISRLYYRRGRKWEFNESGIDIFEKDWDTLALLDACRYDTFSDVNELPGELRSVESRAASTYEFLVANVSERRLWDTVYVTANPMLHRHREQLLPDFHAVENVWANEGWDEEYRTVRPKTVTEAAIRAHRRHPNKRLLVHYIQPHYPYIGPIGREHFPLQNLSLKNELAETDVSKETLKRAYRENLELALPAVRDLQKSVDGRTVISSDHGELLGERTGPVPLTEYGHPSGIYISALTQVPWHVCPTSERREIVETKPEQDAEKIESETVNDRLTALGYK
ncbi:hypothetical protein G9464_01220 [Halostella sp. JP-L12]|uniref:hypothetical protein n=1 Tax=Halostella TaxID=1843185 RepID=UPI0013CF0342|nr:MULTISPECIES: hypothetical protein [Halostella]NHN46220.1 hypothetical protein [Halostella sp. JP-L12]